MSECCDCGFWNGDYDSCTCPSSDKWYACPVESKKPENVDTLKDYVEWTSKEGE